MRPDKPEGVALGYYLEGIKLLEDEDGDSSDNDLRLLIPNWSRIRRGVRMSVDHVIELQVTLPSARDSWADTISNYELLDLDTNQAAGSRLKAAIRRERNRLQAETGDASWQQRNLEFKKVVVDGGGPDGQRWAREEIQRGEHVQVLRELLGLSPSSGKRK
jgi:hypothetical protein